MKKIGIVVVILVLGLTLFNALFMLISPSRWFDLPEWLTMRGYFTRDRYGQGWGAMWVRLAGLAISALIAYMVFLALRAR